MQFIRGVRENVVSSIQLFISNFRSIEDINEIRIQAIMSDLTHNTVSRVDCNFILDKSKCVIRLYDYLNDECTSFVENCFKEYDVSNFNLLDVREHLSKDDSPINNPFQQYNLVCEVIEKDGVRSCINFSTDELSNQAMHLHDVHLPKDWVINDVSKTIELLFNKYSPRPTIKKSRLY